MKFCSWVLLAAAVTLVSCSTDAVSKGVTIEKSFRSLLWPESTVLAQVDLEELKQTGLYKRHADLLDLPMLNEASQKIGLDPRRDLQKVLFQSDGRRSLLLVQGSFKSAEVNRKLSQAGGKAATYRSFQVLGDDRNSLAILSDGLAIAGPAEAVRFTIDGKERKTGAVPADLKTRLEAIEKTSQFWVVSSKGLPLAGVAMRSDVQSALSNIVTFVSGTTAGVKVTDGIDLTATLNCVSAEGAKRVHDALRGVIGLARLSTKDDQVELLRVYDAIKVEQNGTNVAVKAALNGQEVDRLTTYLLQFRKN